MHTKLFLIFAMVALTACATTPAKIAPTPQVSSITSIGTSVWEVGQKTDLPNGLAWAEVGTLDNPHKV